MKPATNTFQRLNGRLVTNAKNVERHVITFFENHISKGAHVFTDKWAGYIPLKKDYPKLKQTPSNNGKSHPDMHIHIMNLKGWLRGIQKTEFFAEFNYHIDYQYYTCFFEKFINNTGLKIVHYTNFFINCHWVFVKLVEYICLKFWQITNRLAYSIGLLYPNTKPLTR